MLQKSNAESSRLYSPSLIILFKKMLLLAKMAVVLHIVLLRLAVFLLPAVSI
jgi:hypothetical protein